MAKKVTLPIGNKAIFDSLAKIALKCEKKKPDDAQKFMKEVGDELAEEAFLFSFTPSGEIGDNPIQKSESEIFLKSFDNIFSKNYGVIALAMKGESKAKINNAIRRIKAALVEISKIYTKEMIPKRDSRSSGQVNNEIDKYLNLFVTTLLFNQVGNILSIEPSDILREMKKFKTLGISDAMNDKEKLRILKSSENKKRFIDKIKKFQ
jgi:hypothetical protein